MTALQPNRLCVITPRILGLDTGPEAEQALALCSHLRSSDQRITVIYTGNALASFGGQWQRHFERQGLDFIWLSDIPEFPYSLRNHDFFLHSHRLWQYLRTFNFDLVCFQDDISSAFHTLQAKTVLGEFENTQVVVNATYNAQWRHMTSETWLPDPLPDAKIQWCERYCVQYCDTLLVANPSILKWMTSHEWLMPVGLVCLSATDAVGPSLLQHVVSHWKKENKTAIRVGPFEPEKVSICVPYYNYGKYIGALLKSILGLNYSNWELIVVDDGSQDPYSAVMFDALMASFEDDRCVFVRQTNQGVGAARNRAAAMATGTYLVFMDADNLACPNMLNVFTEAMDRTQADALTCYFKAFDADCDAPGADYVPLFAYTPIGPALEIGWFENVFGDANMIIRKTVFDALGGYSTDRSTSWEDWEFLARLSLQGFHQDVVPDMLFWYRFTPEGLSRNTSIYANQRRVIQAYIDNTPPKQRWLFQNVLMSLQQALIEKSNLASQQRDWLDQLENRLDA